MSAFLFECPITGQRVQGWHPDVPDHVRAIDTYTAVTCPACARWHHVNVWTGAVLGADSGQTARTSQGRNPADRPNPGKAQ